MSRKRLFQFSIPVLVIALLITGWSTYSSGSNLQSQSQPKTSASDQPTGDLTLSSSPSPPPAEVKMAEPSPTTPPQGETLPAAEHQEPAGAEPATRVSSQLNPEPPPNEPQSVIYSIRQTFEIRNQEPVDGSSLEITVAKIRTIDPFQEVTSFSVEPDLEYREKSDEHGNQYLVFELKDLPTQEKIRLTLNYEVIVHAQAIQSQDCEGDLIAEYTQPEQYIESDSPEISALVEKLSRDTTNACEQSRLFYDYVTRTLAYSGHTRESRGALHALIYKAGDCTEFADLLIALNRSAGIPARFVEGVTPLGGDESHDWAQVYLPGSGWTAMDPTWGRKSENRETYFAGTTPDHIIVTTGRNLEALNGFHYWTYSYTCPKISAHQDVNISMDWDIKKVGE